MDRFFRMRVRPCVWAVFLILVFAVAAIPVEAQTQDMCNTGVCVLTWQQDTGTDIGSGYSYRTGQNLSESAITYSSITTDNFGQLCSVALDGQVYAQPLVVTDVVFKNQTQAKTVAYVVTQNDSVYAIDGTNCAVLGQASLLLYNFSGQPTMTAVDCTQIGGKLCYPINPTVGILGTPVINVSSGGTAGTLYVVAYMQSYDSVTGVYTFYHFLHALDITTLNEGVGNENFSAPIQICSNANLCGSAMSASSFSHDHIQRPGLLYVPSGKNGLTHDTLYIAFSMMDGTTPPAFPNGVMVGYNASTLSDTARLSFQTSTGNGSFTSNGGGIWMSGAAPAFGPDAASGSNWIYVTTANGTWDGSTNWGDSMLKLSPKYLTVPATNGYFTPADQYYRSSWSGSSPSCPANLPYYPKGGDSDVGVGGITLIPDSELANWSYLAVSGEKEGGIWFYDRSTPMPSRTTACDPPHDLCNCPESSYPDHNVQTYWGSGGQFSGNVMRGGIAYWEKEPGPPGQSYIYASPYGSALTQYPLCGGTTATGPIDTTHCSPVPASTSVTFATGATPTVSAESQRAAGGIVWAIWATGDVQYPLPTSPGILYAFDASTMSQLYASATCTADVIAPATKFSVPTVANGYVYVGTEGKSTDSGYPNAGHFYIFGPGRTGC
ncbi:exported hypothetical protein [Candidatus Sulfotelmatobacter sp. SbA7]|nr:exported hypothetical protein [Candidatus Sulfotelmatobacter sp. SbA7]